MCSTVESVVAAIRRGALVTAVVSSGMIAPGCGNSGGSPSGPTPLAYPLRGVVIDTAGVPLPGATVEVGTTTGTLAPVVTGTDGRFETAAVSGTVSIRVSKDGYVGALQTITAPASELVFRLQRSTARTLLFTASSSCSLPVEARSRRYSVEVGDSDGAIVVRVVDREGVPYANELGFTGWRDGNRVTFTLLDLGVDKWAFVEAIWEQQQTFALVGTATGTMTETGFSATFDGSVLVRSFASDNIVAQCRAGDHRLEIVR